MDLMEQDTLRVDETVQSAMSLNFPAQPLSAKRPPDEGPNSLAKSQRSPQSSGGLLLLDECC
jgi:hypothetical protein